MLITTNGIQTAIGNGLKIVQYEVVTLTESFPALYKTENLVFKTGLEKSKFCARSIVISVSPMAKSAS